MAEGENVSPCGMVSVAAIPLLMTAVSPSPGTLCCSQLSGSHRLPAAPPIHEFSTEP